MLCSTPLSGESSIMPMLQLPKDQGIISKHHTFLCSTFPWRGEAFNTRCIPCFGLGSLEALWFTELHRVLDSQGTGYYWMVSPGLYWIHMCTSQALANLQRLCTTSHRVTVWYIMIQFTSVYCMLFQVVSCCFMLFRCGVLLKETLVFWSKSRIILLPGTWEQLL